MKTRVSLRYFVTDCSLKSEIDKLDIGKLEATLVDLSKLWDVVKMKLLKRLCMMNYLKKLMLFRLSMLSI